MEHKAKQWFKPLARIGYASRGLIYLVIGYFAALAAIGAGQPMGSREALGKLLTSGAGAIMAYGLIAALIFYAAWRLIQSGFDTDDHGIDPKGLAIRGGLAASGVIYLTLAFYVWSLRSAAETAAAAVVSPRRWQASSAAAGHRRRWPSCWPASPLPTSPRQSAGSMPIIWTPAVTP